MTTPYLKFLGIKSDYQILFPFGCVSDFWRVDDGKPTSTNFESQCILGIALGRSEFTNGMVFNNPILNSFCTSAEYHIHKNVTLVENFFSQIQWGN